MSKDPAFLFYTNDFSSGTQFFSDEQVGKYIRLLLAQHQHGHLTEKQMIIICKQRDVEIFEKFTQDSDGKFFNKRLEEETEKRKNFSESRRNNLTGKNQWSKIGHKTKHMKGHMEDRDINKNVNKKTNKTETEIIFPFNSEKFKMNWGLWKKYKSDQHQFTYKGSLSEQSALKKISELSFGSEDDAIKIIHQSIENGWKGLFKLNNNSNGQQSATSKFEQRFKRSDVEEGHKKYFTSGQPSNDTNTGG